LIYPVTTFSADVYDYAKGAASRSVVNKNLPKPTSQFAYKSPEIPGLEQAQIKLAAESAYPKRYGMEEEMSAASFVGGLWATEAISFSSGKLKQMRRILSLHFQVTTPILII